MQLGLFSSNYLIRTYSGKKKKKKICFFVCFIFLLFFFQLPLVSLTPIPVQESRALQSPPPSCTWEAAAEQSWLKSTPRRHYLHHTSTSVLAERKRQTTMELNICGKMIATASTNFRRDRFHGFLYSLFTDEKQ